LVRGGEEGQGVADRQAAGQGEEGYLEVEGAQGDGGD
jgi:hypothetical protein